MSLTVTQARTNVRLMLGDTDTGALAINNEPLTRILVRQGQLYTGIQSPSPEWQTAALTLSDTGSPDFTFAGSYQYDGVLKLRLASDGTEIVRLDKDMLEGMRANSAPGTGKPTWYYLFETTGPVLKARLFPRPIVADTVDALASFYSAATYTDATVLDASEYLLRVIELGAAIEAMARMVQSDRDRLKLSADVIALWTADRERFLKHEDERYRRLVRLPYISQQVA